MSEQTTTTARRDDTERASSPFDRAPGVSDRVFKVFRGVWTSRFYLECVYVETNSISALITGKLA